MENAPKDSTDPWVVGARRRLRRWDDGTDVLAALEDRPYLVDESTAQTMVGRFIAAGFIRLEVDVPEGGSELDLLQALARTYDFPDYFGENWPAYTDCYSDFVVAGEEPVVTVVRGLDGMHRRDLRQFMRCVMELETTAEFISVFKPVVPRRVVNLYVGEW
ncbi:barstar family protein [Embleya sp. NPDC005971]|uniref:barstar family protein n=1 Tax=Embleya sp. NPDC005971 TaxID=3156724 RepID=UPI0033CA8CCC